MPTGIVTGASRGLGLALTRALSAAGWRLVVDARDGAALERATAGLDGVWRCPATSPTAGTARALAIEAGDRIDLLVNNASVLGPSPQPPLADYPLADLDRVYTRQRPRAARALPGRAAAPGAGRARPERDLRRGGRALPRLGRLRVLQGGPRAAHRRPRRRASGAAHPCRRPGRHAHRSSSRRPSRARTSPTGPRRRTACRGCWSSSWASTPAAGTGPRTWARCAG